MRHHELGLPSPKLSHRSLAGDYGHERVQSNDDEPADQNYGRAAKTNRDYQQPDCSQQQGRLLKSRHVLL